MTKIKTQANKLLSITRLTRTMYFFIAIYALSIIIFDSGNLITKDAVVDRWTLATALLTVNTAAWFLSSLSKQTIGLHKILLAAITLTLLGFAGFTTYWERGMASTSTILYVLPLLVTAIAKNRHALLATATLAAGTYSFSAVKYFNDFFNEGLRIQLWGSIAFYCGVIFTCAWLIMVIADLRQDSQ